MASKLLEAFVEISGNDAKLKKALDKAEKDVKKSADTMEVRLRKLGDNMSKIGQWWTVGVTLPIVAGFGVFTKAAMDATESESLFSVSMGRMAEQARMWSEEMQKTLGLNAHDVRKTIGTFNVMLASMGLSENQAYDMSKSMTKLSYDMASFYNLEPEQAFEKLQSGISGEVEPLKRLGIIINETTAKTYAYTHGIARQGDELTEQQKVLARYGVIMEQTSKAQGDLARTIDSPANRIRILRSQLESLSIALGNVLLPIFGQIVGNVTKVVQSLNNMSPVMKKIVVVFGALLAAIGPVLAIFGPLVSTYATLSAAAAITGTTVTALIGTFAASIGIVVGITAAIIALVAGLAWVIKRSNELHDIEGRRIKQGRQEAETAQAQANAKQAQAERARQLIREYETLSGKTNRTAAENAHLKVVLEDIRQLFPDLVSGTTLQADALDKLSQKTRQYADDLSKAQKAQAEWDVKDIQNRLKKLNETEKVLKQMQSGNWAQRGMGWLGATLSGKDTPEELLRKLPKARAVLEEKLAKAQMGADESQVPAIDEDALKKEMEDAKAAQERQYQIRLRNADAIKKLEMQRNRELNERDESGNLKHGPKERAMIWADYEDQIKKELERQSKERAETAKREAEKLAQVAQELAEKRARIWESEVQGYEETLALQLRATGQTYAAEVQEAYNARNQEIRSLYALAQAGEDVTNRMYATELRYYTDIQAIDKRYNDARTEAFRRATDRAIELNNQDIEEKRKASEMFVDLVQNASLKIIEAIHGETAARLMAINIERKAKAKEIDETIKDEKMRAAALQALDLDMATQRAKLADEDMERQRKLVDGMFGFTNADEVWRRAQLSAAKINFMPQFSRPGSQESGEWAAIKSFLEKDTDISRQILSAIRDLAPGY